MARKPNILLIVIDQLRADCVFGALADHVEMLNIRALAGDGIAFRNHFSVLAPCGPSRASLLTGQYGMNHRAVRNGTPLRADTPTLGTELAKAGYEPLLYGYTDISPDPRGMPEDDPRLFSYEGLANGFTERLRLRLDSDVTAWTDHLVSLGIDVPDGAALYRPAGDRPEDPAIYPAEASDTAFLTDRALADLAERPQGWCALVTYIRPHPPFVAPAPYNRMYDPATLPAPMSPGQTGHPFDAVARRNAPISKTVVGFPDLSPTPENVALMRGLYFGLATEVDHHVGRILDWLRDTGALNDTIVVLTADHGEMLGDFGCWGKMTHHDAAFHVPLIVRVPGGLRGVDVEAPTESVDIMPTLLDLAGQAIPPSVDGRSLRSFLETGTAAGWRETSFSELDFGDPITPHQMQQGLELAVDSANLAVIRHGSRRLVQFADRLPARLFDVSDGGEAVDLANDPAMMPILLDLSGRMLCHRMQNAEGTFSRTMITEDGPKTAL